MPNRILKPTLSLEFKSQKTEHLMSLERHSFLE